MYKKGFTVIELLVVSALIAILAIGVSRFGRDLFYYNNIFNNSLLTLQDAKRALRPFAQEVRNIRRAQTGAYAIEEATPTSFIFYSDIDSDGMSERIRYFLDADNVLKRGVTETDGQSYLIANENITDLISGILNTAGVFQYFDATHKTFNAPNCANDQSWMSIQISNYSNTGNGNTSPLAYVGSVSDTYDASITDVDYIFIHDGLHSVVDSGIAGYLDVPGISVERMENNRVKVVLHGGHSSSSSKEFVSGALTVSNATIESFVSDSFYTLEGLYTDGSGLTTTDNNDDELVRIDDSSISFDIGASTDSDGFIITYSDPEAGLSCTSNTVPIYDIRMISITAILDLDPQRSPLPLTISTQATVRNLKYVQ